MIKINTLFCEYCLKIFREYKGENMGVNYNKLLQDISMIIQIYEKRDLSLESKMVSYERSVWSKYNLLLKNDLVTPFYDFLRIEFGNETELYLSLLSVIYDCTKSEYTLQEILNIMKTNQVDLLNSIWYRQQMEYQFFNNVNVSSNYELRRELHKIQLTELEKKYNCNKPYIPHIKRDQNKIVIVTNQLLGIEHAPTRNVLEICSALQDIGKEVLLVVAVEIDKTISTALGCSWYKPIVQNYYDSYTGIFKIPYYANNIEGLQFILTDENGIEVTDVIEFIYNYNPQFIWYMGGTSLFADLFRKVTTVVSMPFSDGHIISEAPILIEYMKSNSKDIITMENYIYKQGQSIVHFNYEQPIHPSIRSYNRSEFGLKEDDFIIAIVGNRLDSDITKDMVHIINHILEISHNIHLVFIGEIHKLTSIKEENRVSYLGFQPDLIGVLSLFDLFINPPRKGGGTGAYWALYNSVPVITLDNCDVANCVTSEFICNDIRDMISIVNRHYNDKDFHQDMKARAKAIINQIEDENDLSKNLNRLIIDIKEITIHNEKILF